MNNNVPKLRFEGFNDKWRATKLGEIIDYKKGFAFKSKDYVDNGVRVIKISDTTTSSVSEEGNTFVRFEMFEEFKEWALKTEDIIISTVGSRPPLYSSMVGKVVKIPEFCNGSLLNQNLVKLVPKDIINTFLYSLLRKTRYTKHIENICRGNANQVSITLEELFDFKVNIPSLQEQEKIADFFTILDSLIEEQDGKVSDLELYKKGMMQKIFSQEIRFKDENGCDYPEWKEDRLNHLFKITAGGDIKKEHVSEHKNKIYEYPIYANSLVEKGLYGYSDTYKIEGDSITVTGRGSLGYAIARYEKYYPIVRLLVLKPLDIEKYDVKFFEAAINNIKIFVESTGVPQLTAPQIGNIQVKYPSIEEQNKIAEFLTNIDNLIEEEKKNLADLKEMKKGLLQQMFR
ncbi:restriction endonuclease subunit S [Cetobacterium sp.]|uniref:restriction endonuclease subunit S n=1 Tax=Cetobacterium sp. TaxID=2071632 RepID=UPI003EE75E04